MHLDLEQLQRLLHDELADPAESAAREHLAACEACRARLVEAQREERDVFALLRAVDHDPPPLTADAVMARGRRRRFGGMRWAALAVLALGIAGAAYAVPGSPVRSWVREIARRIAAEPAPPEPPTSATIETPALAGIAVDPGRYLRIVFSSYQSAGAIRVMLWDSSEVSASAPAGAATFTTAGDRLVVANDEGTASFEIRIPRAAPWVEIHVGGSRTFLKRGPDISAPGAAALGVWVLPMQRPGR